MYIHIDIETKKSHGLSIREAWMYSALCYLSKNAPYQGSYAELAELVDFESKTSTHRIVAQLIKKGLVFSTDGGLKAFHSGTSHSGTESSHSGTDSFQNGTNSKRKSNQKENIKENKEESECENSAHTHTREILKDKFIKPNWKEWYGYGKEQGIDYLTCLKSFAYYESVGWAKISNWRATLIYWDLKDKTRR